MKADLERGDPTSGAADSGGGTVGELLANARRRLRGARFGPSTREAALLLGHVLGLGEARLLAHPESVVAPPEAERFAVLLGRRLRGEPVAYLLGEKEFYGRPFLVDRRVLVPRPETEHLIEAALGLALPPRPWIADVGTGSGCLAVTLALELPAARVLALDLSPAALQVARANVARHAVEDRVRPLLADLTGPLRLARLDLLVANPPYVAGDDPAAVAPEVRHFEPHVALFAPGNAWSVLGRLLDAAAALSPGTHLLLEVGHDQAAWLRREVAHRPSLGLIALNPDYAGIPRTAILRRRQSPQGRLPV